MMHISLALCPQSAVYIMYMAQLGKNRHITNRNAAKQSPIRIAEDEWNATQQRHIIAQRKKRKNSAALFKKKVIIIIFHDGSSFGGIFFSLRPIFTRLLTAQPSGIVHFISLDFFTLSSLQKINSFRTRRFTFKKKGFFFFFFFNHLAAGEEVLFSSWLY